MKYQICFFLLFTAIIPAQVIHVNLDTLSTLDDENFHTELLSDISKEKLVLPNVEQNGIKYFTLFYSWKTKNDQDISVLVKQEKERDVLYVDKNNDEDMNNDGEPLIFYHTENSKYINIIAEDDPEQIVRLIIYRIPPLNDSSRVRYFDNQDNFNPKFAKFYGTIKNETNFEGKKGTFYCDDRISVRKGEIEINSINYKIGLFDYSNNGLFNDDDDLILVDLNRDGKLKYIDIEEVFKLNDVIHLGNSNYELKNIDRYGRGIDFVKTSKNPTNYLLDYDIEALSSHGQKRILSEKFWELNLKAIDGRDIVFSGLKGKYIYLNIWGEWCLPCIQEIPELRRSYYKWKDQVIFISILKTFNLEKAKEIISKEDISWPQILMTPELENGFKIKTFPTNMLIFKDGRHYIKEGQVNNNFFDLNLK